jgi:hypothetical protein
LALWLGSWASGILDENGVFGKWTKPVRHCPTTPLHDHLRDYDGFETCMRFFLRVLVALLSAVGAFVLSIQAVAWRITSMTGPRVFQEEAGANMTMLVVCIFIAAPLAVAAFVTSLMLSSGSRSRAA